MTPLDVLRAASANCHACHGIIPDNLTPEGLANQLRGHGIDPLTLQQATAEQVAQWRRELGFVMGERHE